LASACTPAGATVAPTDDGLLGIRLLEAPVARRNDPRARVYIVDHVAPGTTIERRIAIEHKRGTDRVQQIPVTVYPAAAAIDAKGFQFGVGAGGEKPSNFDIGTITGRRDANGVPRLTAEVRNTGARALDMGGSVSLAGGPGGVRAGPFPTAGSVTIGIRQGGSVTAALDPRLPDGPWTATVTLQSGTVKKTKTVKITFPPEPQAVAVAGEPPGNGPWVLVGGAVGLALLVGLLALLARRRRGLVPDG
jgi:hypothetical protein